MSSRWVSKPPVGSMLDFGHPLSKGLVGAWLMNEGGGNVVRDLANSNNGVFSAGVSWGGIYGGVSPKFDAASSYISCGKPNKLNNLTNRTIACVFYKTADNGSSAYPPVLDKLSGTAGWSLRAVQSTGANPLAFNFLAYRAGGVFIQQSTPNNIIQNNIPIFPVVTWTGEDDASKIYIYINGKLNDLRGTGSAGASPSDDSSINFSIGGRPSAARAVGGFLPFAYVWNRILSPSEIKSLYESPYQFIKGPSTITYFTPPAVGGWVWGGEVKNVMVA